MPVSILRCTQARIIFPVRVGVRYMVLLLLHDNFIILIEYGGICVIQYQTESTRSALGIQK